MLFNRIIDPSQREQCLPFKASVSVVIPYLVPFSGLVLSSTASYGPIEGNQTTASNGSAHRTAPRRVAHRPCQSGTRARARHVGVPEHPGWVRKPEKRAKQSPIRGVF